MKKTCKRVLAFALSLVLVFSVISVGAVAIACLAIANTVSVGSDGSTVINANSVEEAINYMEANPEMFYEDKADSYAATATPQRDAVIYPTVIIPGISQSVSYLADENGDPAPVYSVASGLDYPSSGPEHAFLQEIGRVKYDVIDDEETIDAFFKLARMEGIIPAIESSHAVAYGMKLAKTMDHGSILINLSGRGDKDMDFVIENYGIR